MDGISNDPHICAGQSLAGVCSFRETAERGRRCVHCLRPDAMTAFREAQVEQAIASLEVWLRERRDRRAS